MSSKEPSRLNERETRRKIETNLALYTILISCISIIVIVIMR